MKWLEITTKLPCINNCKYCPQDKLNQAYNGKKELNFDDFKVFLSNVDKDIEIHFSGFSEPFLNEKALDMMEYAAKEYSVTIYTTLIGLKDKERFKKIPFKYVRVHDIGQKIDDDLKINFSKVTNIQSRAGNLDRFGCNNIKAIGCSRGFNPVMLPNGDVCQCCQDYGLTNILGNLKELIYY